MNSIARLRLIQSIILSLALAPTAWAQGPLAPPGSPAPTMKTLNQIDARVATAGERIPVNATTCPTDGSAVYVIAQSGSYFLTGNVAGVAGRDGIHITAKDVTLDLNGYQLDGSSAPAQTGILIDLDNVTVRNGRVVGWGNRGVDVEGSGATEFDRLVVANCGTGFFAFGVVRYESCSAIGNTTNGFDGWLGHQYRACFSADNGANGFSFYDGNTAVDCLSVRDGVGFAFNGPGAVARNCSASQFLGLGFIVFGQSNSLLNCTATSSTAGGSAYVILDPGKGIPSGAILDQCTAAFFPGLGSNIGFDASTATGVTFTACVATGFGGAGFFVGPYGMVTGCSASQNGGAGIIYTTGCAVLGNTVSANANNGIVGAGVQNRIDGNTVTRHDGTGIQSTDAAETNVIVRNVSRNFGANYDPALGANVGPIGQLPANTIPPASPWANF